MYTRTHPPLSHHVVFRAAQGPIKAPRVYADLDCCRTSPTHRPHQDPYAPQTSSNSKYVPAWSVPKAPRSVQTHHATTVRVNPIRLVFTCIVTPSQQHLMENSSHIAGASSRPRMARLTLVCISEVLKGCHGRRFITQLQDVRSTNP